MILHIRNILIDMLGLWSRDVEIETVPETANLGSFMLDWASSLTAVYTVAELKTEYAQCCSCLEESQGKSVLFANLPAKLGEYLKENFSTFYKQFCILRRKRARTRASTPMEVKMVGRKMTKQIQMVNIVTSQHLLNKC